MPQTFENMPECAKIKTCQSMPEDAKRMWMWPSATPATQNECGCDQVPRLPRKTKVDVTKCHACHAKCRGAATKTGPSAPPEPAQCHKCLAWHTKRMWMWPSATPATQNECGCDQVPRLPRKTKVDVTKCHACHAKCRGAATKTGPSAPPEPAQCHTCLACHAKRRWMWPSATPATQNEGGCH